MVALYKKVHLVSFRIGFVGIDVIGCWGLCNKSSVKNEAAIVAALGSYSLTYGAKIATTSLGLHLAR
jgi:hypothetical protein